MCVVLLVESRRRIWGVCCSFTVGSYEYDFGGELTVFYW